MTTTDPDRPGPGEDFDLRLQELTDALPEGYVAVGPDGGIVEWNPAAERIFGWRREEVIGHRFDLTPRPGGVLNDGADLGPAAENSALVKGREKLSARRRDGSEVPVEVSVWESRIRGGTLLNVYLRDLTDDRSCFHGSIVDSSEEAIIGQDTDGVVRTWNRGAERIYGYTAAEIVGRHITTLAPPGARAELDDLVAQARAGKSVSAREAVRVRKDGSMLDVAESFVATRDESGAMTGISAIARDVTEQHRAASRLEAALDAARESEARSRRFLADTAHQLRTPIAGIQTCAQTLRLDVTHAERERLLADVVNEASRAGRLMAALLQMGRLDRGDALLRSPCDIVGVCHEEIERLRRRAPKLAVDLKVVSSPDLKPCVDGNALAEILGNLLDNAERHAVAAIHLVLTVGDGWAEIRVTDDGPGIPSEKVEAAFERFVSLDGQGGSGLGLPIARGLAQAHGGDLTYQAGQFVLRVPSEP